MSNSKVPVFFSESQLHDPCSFSKSPLKPGLLAERIQNDPAFEIKSGLIGPADPERLKQTHEARYIDGLMDGTIADGFGNKSIPGSIHAKDFKAIRTTAGNFLAAAEWAVAMPNCGVVWSLTSGFHHANPGHAEGFCTLEALTLAAYELNKYRGLRTLIVDEDFHFFNGCVAVLERKPEMKEYVSLMSNRHTHCHPDQVDLGARLLDIATRIATFKPDVILYQMGVDMWICDPLGGSLTGSQLYHRDVGTFMLAKRYGIPVVANLAGGYGLNYNDTLQLHMNSGEAMKEVYLQVKGCPVFPKEDCDAGTY